MERSFGPDQVIAYAWIVHCMRQDTLRQCFKLFLRDLKILNKLNYPPSLPNVISLVSVGVPMILQKQNEIREKN